jgi:hypothetical protein
MKQYEKVTDMLITEFEKVHKDNGNPKHLLALATAADAMARINVGASTHMKSKREMSDIKFFDKKL